MLFGFWLAFFNIHVPLDMQLTVEIQLWEAFKSASWKVLIL